MARKSPARSQSGRRTTSRAQTSEFGRVLLRLGAFILQALRLFSSYKRFFAQEKKRNRVQENTKRQSSDPLSRSRASNPKEGSRFWSKFARPAVSEKKAQGASFTPQKPVASHKQSAVADHSRFERLSPKKGRGAFLLQIFVFILLVAALLGFLGTRFGQLKLETWRTEFKESLKKQGFTISRVVIDGRIRTPRQVIMKALDIRPNMLFFDFDHEQALESLLQLTWVKGVRIERHFPGTLIVKLTEKQPLAFWKSGNKTYLLDLSGDTIGEFSLASFPHLIVLTGAGAPKQAHQLLQNIAIFPDLFQKVQGAAFVSKRRWDLFLKGGVRIKMPENYADYTTRLALLQDLLQKEQVSLGNVDIIDLRHGDRLYLDMSKVIKDQKSKGRKKQA